MYARRRGQGFKIVKELLSEQYAHQLCIIHQAEAGPQFIMSAGGNQVLTAELGLIITIVPFNI